MEKLKFSLFVGNGIYNTDPKREINFKQLVEILESDQLKLLSKQIRDCLDPKIRKSLKMQLPYITTYGTFTKRNNDSIVHFNNNLVAFDFDDLDLDSIDFIKSKCRKSSNVLYCGKSPRSNGVKILMLVNHEFTTRNHRENLLIYAEEIQKDLGIEEFECDIAQFTLSQPYFISHDIDSHINFEAVATNGTYKEKQKEKIELPLRTFIGNTSRIDHVLVGMLIKKCSYIKAESKKGHRIIQNCIKLVGTMKHYNNDLESQFFEYLENAFIYLYGSEKEYLAYNGKTTLESVFKTADHRNDELLDKLATDIENIDKAFNSFVNKENKSYGVDTITSENNLITWIHKGQVLISFCEVSATYIFYNRYCRNLTIEKRERVEKFSFVNADDLEKVHKLTFDNTSINSLKS